MVRNLFFRYTHLLFTIIILSDPFFNTGAIPISLPIGSNKKNFL